MATTLPLEGSAGELRSRIGGTVHTPEDASFEELRLAWNRAYEHRPALIVVPDSAADVAAAVRYAVDRRMKVTVQATGHGVAQPANGGLLLLTHRLNEVTVDGDAWTARIGGGATWRPVLAVTTEVGLAPLLGSTPDVSAVGYTLGGGMGWLARKYGLSADHVRSFDIVTADGRIRRTSPEEDADLFWALRGAGAGSFGVVTAMEIDLVPVASLYAGNLLYPADMARAVAERYRDWIEQAPDELTSALTFAVLPDTNDVPAAQRGGSFVIVRGALIGSDGEGEAIMRYWREWQAPRVDMWGRIPVADVATISQDPVEPLEGFVTTNFIDGLSDDVIDVLAGSMFDATRPSPLMVAEVRHAGGAVARQPEHPNAYSTRERRHVLELFGIVSTPGSRSVIEAAARDLQRRIAAQTAPGAYLNFLEGDEKVRRSPEAFTPATWERLGRVKAAYDPMDVFSHGIPITP